MKTFLATLIVAALAFPAAAQTPPAAPFQESISVNGTGRSSVSPDRVSFSLGVQTVAPTVDQAVNENNQRLAAVLAALKKAGATQGDLTTSNFTIYPQQDYSQGKLPRILGYQVSNNVTVRRPDVTQAGKLLQAALNAGVNVSSGLQFEVSDPSKGRDQALRAAFDDARSKAVLLAQAAGRTLGRALTISEAGMATPPPYPRPMAMRAQAADVVSEVPVESGTQEVSYSVSVVFELK